MTVNLLGDCGWHGHAHYGQTNLCECGQVSNFYCDQFPLDQDVFDPGQKVNKWFTTFPLNKFHE